VHQALVLTLKEGALEEYIVTTTRLEEYIVTTTR
jgi:hypothetical protein